MGTVMFGLGLIEFSGVVPSFMLSWMIIFMDISLNETERFIVQDNSLFSVRGQETCEHVNNLPQALDVRLFFQNSTVFLLYCILGITLIDFFHF